MDAFNIARLQNMATNGRWFCVGVSLINYLSGSPLLALLMLLTLILAVAADLLRVPAFGVFCYAYAATIFAFSLLNLW